MAKKKIIDGLLRPGTEIQITFIDSTIPEPYMLVTDGRKFSLMGMSDTLRGRILNVSIPVSGEFAISEEELENFVSDAFSHNGRNRIQNFEIIFRNETQRQKLKVS